MIIFYSAIEIGLYSLYRKKVIAAFDLNKKIVRSPYSFREKMKGKPFSKNHHFAYARARGRALMTRKSCAVGMALLARARARAHWKHDGFALILSSVSWKMALAHQRTRAPQFFSTHCNQLITSFAWEKTDLISIAENWINRKNSRYAVVFSILQFGNHVKKFGSNF